ncbi:hypothetical protein PAP_07005 [Palaeococcus pacificus DY20341]|uniref:DUF1097 domain-containing protein n=1 Tax=Palaeococcus pacificus DY20341 TaxID=1343739 RepID=A0A075LYZ9_9EURY|nr:hypothetical protein [Palaeococcus pacificus]AIF69793.1 hypothetical protein PAP_07005 [Palaeococcus pacificus DY20341]
MNQKLLNVLSFGGTGITLAFFLLLAFFPLSTGIETFSLMYATFFFLGAFVGLKKGEANTSGIAFLLGFAATSVLYVVWLTFGFRFAMSLVFAGASAIFLYTFNPSGLLDAILTPFAYFGGFIFSNLLFANSRIPTIEGALLSISLAGVLGAFIAMMVAFLRIFVEESKRFSQKKPL